MLAIPLLLCLLDGSGFDALLSDALTRNPEILAARKKLEAARQRPAIEKSLPDPMLSLGYKSVGGPLPGQRLGVEPLSNIGFMIGQNFPAPGKRDLRARIAIKEADAMTQEYWQVQLSVAARLKTAWHRLHHAHSMLDLMERNRQLQERIIKATEARYAGKQGDERLLAGLDGELYRFLLDVRRQLPDRPANKLFIISAEPGDFWSGRARYHLLPHNGYMKFSQPPSAGVARQGDFVLVLSPLPGVRYDRNRQILEWTGGELPVDLLHSATSGALFRVRGG